MVRTVAGCLVQAGRVGLLPAAFDPPTVAHVALADGAQDRFALDQVVFVLPEALPHKRIERPAGRERLQWLGKLARSRPDRVAASCPTGLVIDIVQAFRAALSERCEIFVIAGRDAAERYAAWDYGDGMPFAEQLRRYRLLVAARSGAYAVPPEHAGRILPFEIDALRGAASSTAVREAQRAGAPWEHMVPAAIREDMARAYREERR